MTQEEEEQRLKLFKDAAGPGEPFWVILTRDARAALARGDLDLAKKILTMAEKMKVTEERLAKKGPA